LYCEEKKNQQKKWRFIWSLRDEYISYLPSYYQEIKNNNYHLLILPWVPQVEILHHSNVKVVVTHCGWGGVSEIVAAGKPIVAVPFLGDQPGNAKHVEKLGTGLSLDVTKFTSTQVRDTVTEVLINPKYATKMRELQAIEAVVAKTTAQKVIDAVEYVRRFGSKNFIVKQESVWKRRLLIVLGIGLVRLGIYISCKRGIINFWKKSAETLT